jgi:hypothetical protein
MLLQFFNNLSKVKGHYVVTSLCHVERLWGGVRWSVSLNGSSLNGVETSNCVKRCFDSVCGNLTTLLGDFKCCAVVAQHDTRGINYV